MPNQTAGLQAYYQLIITDTKTGKVEWKSKKQISRSFVLQFLQLIGALMKQSHTATIKDTGGTGRTWAACQSGSYDYKLVATSAAGDDTHGTVVGTGTTTPTSSDYKLATQIAHGIGSGQLSYGSVGFVEATIDAGNVDFVITRAFNNGSGAPITVTEIGLYLDEVYTVYTYRFCAIRDVLSTPSTVEAGKTLTVQYTLETTV